MRVEPGFGSDEAATFTRALASMKRRGSNILVVGACDTDPQVVACRRLLGDAPQRRRLFVFTHDGHGVEERLAPAERDASTVRVVDCASTTRSTAAGATPATPDAAVPRTDAPLDDLATLGREIGAAIDRFDAERGGLDPAELRVCVDSLCPLLAEHDDRQVFRFLHALTSDVRRVCGMGHYHLPVTYGADAVSLLAPLFDAVVEVRARPDPEQRWHLPDHEFTTDWLSL